jgi:hypothetical protein
VDRDELISGKSTWVSPLTEPGSWFQDQAHRILGSVSSTNVTSPSIPEQCRRQAGWCESFGSPLYTHLLSRCADVYEVGGSVRDLLQPHEKDDEPSVLHLRLMGAVHRLVLERRAPQLAKFYPSAGGIVEFNEVWEAFSSVVREQTDTLRRLIENPVQTNEFGRCGSLLGGFGLTAEHTGFPLRLLEIGSSAGLNLRWDLYRYEWPGVSWDNAASPVRMEDVFIDGAPFLSSSINIVDRGGCDPSPVDITSDSGRITLLSYVWPDQMDRIRRLEAAIEIARVVPCVIEKMHGAEWLEVHLRNSFAGIATVVFQSAVWQYISESEQQRIVSIIENSGNRASEEAPIAWLRMEAINNIFEIRLRIYPGFKEQIITTSRAHAPSVHWLRAHARGMV